MSLIGAIVIGGCTSQAQLPGEFGMSANGDVHSKDPDATDTAISSGQQDSSTGSSGGVDETFPVGTPDGSSAGSHSPVSASAADTASGTSQDTHKPACHEGTTRSCHELADGRLVSFPLGHPVGSCLAGQSQCVNGAWGPCQGTVAPKAQDTCAAGNDDNCNGKPMEGCSCQAGQTASCGQDTGACAAGTMTCGDNGEWGPCLGEVKPQKEVCDGKNIDEDCNGLADLSDPACTCVEGQLSACVLDAQGDCSLGKKVCTAQGVYSECQPRFAVQAEVCGRAQDGMEERLGLATGDEDCDGLVDETDASTPRPQGCSLYMLDEDNDGYGAMGESLASKVSPATWGCTCPGKQPSSWVRGTEERVNKDCGDCKEGGSDVVPSHWVSFHSEPSECLMANGYGLPFDYNCDGVHNLQYEGEWTCTRQGSACVSKGHWASEIPPDCGQEESDYSKLSCALDGNDCSVPLILPGPKVQRCK